MAGVECYICGVVIGLSDTYEKNRKEDKKTFYCPNGDRNVFLGKSMQEQLDEAKDKTFQLESRARQAENLVERQAKRIAKLVPPPKPKLVKAKTA